MTTIRSHSITLVAFALGGLACTTPPERHRPERPDVLARTVQHVRGTPGPAVEPAVLWLVDENENGTDEAFVGVTVGVRGRFPERFRLRLCDPPPEEAFLRSETFRELVGDSGLNMAIGGITAVREGLLDETPTPVSPAQRHDDDFALGEEQLWDLIYLDRDVEPGPFADEMFGGETPRAGYHLFSGADGSEAPDGLDTRLHIELRDPLPVIGP